MMSPVTTAVAVKAGLFATLVGIAIGAVASWAFECWRAWRGKR